VGAAVEGRLVVCRLVAEVVAAVQVLVVVAVAVAVVLVAVVAVAVAVAEAMRITRTPNRKGRT
jgi:hypothetical protein